MILTCYINTKFYIFSSLVRINTNPNIKSMVIGKDFYLREDVEQIASDLVGKLLVTCIDGHKTSGIIVETEAYRGASDRASHAYPNRKTKRNEIMFAEGGKAYVYLIYGIHYLFNVVTNEIGKPDAVLIRALQPVGGFEIMKNRRRKKDLKRITSGPGVLSEAMGIDLQLYGSNLTGNKVWLEYDISPVDPSLIVRSARIGVSYAGEDAALPWRFYLKDNPWVSKKH